MRFASKEEFRSHCKKALFKKSFDKSVAKRIEELITFLGANDVLLYYPMEHEPDIKELFRSLRRDVNLYLPFMVGQSFVMVKFRLPLKKKRFGIFEPKISKPPKKIDLIVVPVIGVDGDFRRVGFGKGMYDRFFARLARKPLVIFVQNRVCITEQKLCDSYDIQGDLLITPKKIFIRGDSDVGRDIGRKLCSHSKWSCRIFPSKKIGKR